MADGKGADPKINDDVQIIRQILFGEHLETLASRLEHLESTVLELGDALGKETKARLADREADSDGLTQLREELREEFDGLQQKLLEDVDKIAQKQQKALEGLSRKVDKIMREVRKEMSGHESQLENLVGSLASALTAYRRTGEEESE
jgi:predicted  nucleic acid-binding Zn-ribbon protein